MQQYEIQRLRNLPIEGVAERLGLRVTRHKCLCPFHDDHHASLTLSTRRNTYRCFACGAGGGTIDLVMQHLGKDFREACRWLADSHNVIIDEYQPRTPSPTLPPKPFDASRYLRHFEHPWLSDEAQRFLFTERGIDPRVAAWCRLTSWTDRDGTHWLQTPYYNQQRQLIGIQNRNLDYRKDQSEEAKGKEHESQAEKPRFRFPYGARCSIYNLQIIPLLQPHEPLFITEGCSDCWAMLSSGHKAIAIPSATLLKPDDVDQLKQLEALRHTSFHMYPDNDLPGEQLFLQLRHLLPSLVRHQLPPGYKDFAEYYRAAQPASQQTASPPAPPQKGGE